MFSIQAVNLENEAIRLEALDERQHRGGLAEAIRDDESVHHPCNTRLSSRSPPEPAPLAAG